MRDMIAELFPQLFVLIVTLTGLYGGAMAKPESAATCALADFFKAGGGNADAIKQAASAHATGLLAISSFAAAFLAVFLDALFALFVADRAKDILLVVLLVATTELFIFGHMLLSYRPYELALNKVTRVWGGAAGGRFLNIRPASILDLGTYLLLALAIVVGVVKVAPPNWFAQPAPVQAQSAGTAALPPGQK